MLPLLDFLHSIIPATQQWGYVWQVLLVLLIVTVLVVAYVSVLALFLVWLERKVAGHVQNRYGPMEVGWHGTLQTIADGIKLLSKEDIIPGGADPILFTLAPCIILGSAMAVYAALPFSETLLIADMNVALLWILAFGSLTVIGILMAGWSSNNKWSLFGGMRSAAQMVSYEIPAGMALMVPLMMVGSLSLKDIGQFQAGGNWLIFQSPFNFIAFFVYYIAALAETNRTPFDLPEAESELVAGYFTEYTGIRFSFFMLSEYSNMFVVSALAAIVFLGGWNGPFFSGAFWLIVKALFLVFLMMLIRWTFPRFRVDQLMSFCWKFLLPLTLFLFMGNALWVLLFMT